METHLPFYAHIECKSLNIYRSDKNFDQKFLKKYNINVIASTLFL
jgi:hypothetical protein